VAATRRTEKIVDIREIYLTRPASDWLPVLWAEGLTGDAYMIACEPVAMVFHIPLQTMYCRVETRALPDQEAPYWSLPGRVKSLPYAGNPVKEVQP
jgi:hypothetical protein